MKRILSLIFAFTLLFSVFGGGGAFAKDDDLSKEEKVLQNSENKEKSKEKTLKVNSGKTSQKNAIMNVVKAESSNSIPQLESLDPYRWQENVPRNKVIRIEFSSLIQFGNKKISVWDTDTFEDFPIKTEIQGSYLIISPIGNFDPFKEYMIDIKTGAISSSSGYGNVGFYYSFTTNNVISPLVKQFVPSYAEENVSVDRTIKVIFDKQVKLADVSKIIVLGDGNKTVSTTVTVNGDTVLIKPKANLQKNSIYGFGLDEGAVKDSNGAPNQRIISVFLTGSSFGGADPDDGDNEGNILSVTVEYKNTAKIKIQGGKSPYTVKSSNSSVATATVKSNYITISGKKKGEATITVKDKNGKELTIHVNVLDYVVTF